MMIEALEGRTWAIARTVKREIDAVAPFAECGLAMGVPTWSVHHRVVSLIPFPAKCNLHFWQGERLEALVPGRLRGTNAGSIRFLELHSMLDVDGDVRALIREAFSLTLSDLAKEEAARESNAALQF
ncbi:hypothetical protein GCM10007148_04410 [Parvularcula lutaonensis]|nr:hypothetical protein GCM10007148_04410 [Parvularcula lutaonensis]